MYHKDTGAVAYNRHRYRCGENRSKVKSPKGAKKRAYNLLSLYEASEGDPVILVEGESDVHTLTYHGYAAVGFPGAATPDKDLMSPVLALADLKSLSLFVWREPDTGGTGFVKKVTEVAPRAKVIRPPEGIKDPLELHKSGLDFTEIMDGLLRDAATPSESRALSGLVVVKRSEIEQAGFLKHPFLPHGALSLLVGFGGVMKGFFMASVAAALSRGEWIDGTPVDLPEGTSGATVWLSTEDTARRTLGPRYFAADGVEGKFGVWQYATDEQSGRSKAIVLPRDLGQLEAIFDRLRPSLFVLDPWDGFVDGTVNTHASASVRSSFLYPVQEFAMERNAVTVGIGHLNKNEGHSFSNRILGSVAVPNAARSVFAFVEPDDLTNAPEHFIPRDEENDRYLISLKNNLGPLGDTLWLRSEDARVDTVRTRRMVYKGVEPHLTRRALGRAPKDKDGRGRSRDAASVVENYLERVYYAPYKEFRIDKVDTADEIAEKLSVGLSTVKRVLEQEADDGILERSRYKHEETNRWRECFLVPEQVPSHF